MPVHPLLQAVKRNLKRTFLETMSEDGARVMFARLRWGSDTRQVCPDCGTHDRHTYISTRKQWTCKHCGHRFSVISKSLLANAKLPFTKILWALYYFVKNSKGKSVVEYMDMLDVDYKTAFVLFHKFRWALYVTRDLTAMQGEIEVDAAYVFTYVRPSNKKGMRKDRRLKQHQNPNKMALLALRLRGSKGEGAVRTVTIPIRDETEKSVHDIVRGFVAPGSIIYTDEHKAYGALAAEYDLRQVNHQMEYRSDEGHNQNQAESFFSRLRRMLIGQIHKLAPKSLYLYAQELAWREDMRRTSRMEKFESMLKAIFRSSFRNPFVKYWKKRPATEMKRRPRQMSLGVLVGLNQWSPGRVRAPVQLGLSF